MNPTPLFALPALFLLSAAAPGMTAEPAPVSHPESALRRTAEYDYDVPAPGSYVLPVLKPAADGAVLGADGKPVRLHELTDGRVTLLSFIYTRCTDPRACLRASGVLKQLQQLTQTDPVLATNVLLLTLSFDPAHDTPEVMDRYGRVFHRGQGGADWLFLTTESRGQLAPLLDRYGQVVDRARPGSAGGPYNHPLRVYLIDGRKQVRNIYSYGLLDPRLVVTDIRTLLLEAAATGPLTPVEALRHGGQTRAVRFQSACTVTVHDIQGPGREAFSEFQLVDAPNNDEQATPAERARVVVRIPAGRLAQFEAREPADLVRRYRNRWVEATGRIELERRPAGDQRIRITVTDPSQVRLLTGP